MNSIWRTPFTLEDLQQRASRTMAGHLGIRLTAFGPDWLRATMPLDARTRQPAGLLHGGAAAALAETVGSLAASLCIDASTRLCIGQEINANHLLPVTDGEVSATARPIHLGARTQVWSIEIHDERERLVCVGRLTLAVVARCSAPQAAGGPVS